MADDLTAALDEIRAADKAAAPGPWHLDTDSCDCGGDYPCTHGSFPYSFRLPVAHTERPPDDPFRDYDFVYSEVSQFSMESAEFISVARDAVPRLLAAVDGVLALHQAGRITVVGKLCIRHDSARYFSITRTEAADVVGCPDCTATVYDSCAACGTQTRLTSCPVRVAISRALTGEDGTDEGKAVSNPHGDSSNQPIETGVLCRDNGPDAPGSSDDPTPGCGYLPRKPENATELWWCAECSEFHKPKETG